MKIAFLTFLITFSAVAQVKGIVVDESGKPIPYVNIWTENKSSGATSEENGSFEVAVLGINKILVFSSLGYETQKVDVSKAEKVVLKPLAVVLDEVVISKAKQTSEIETGQPKNTFFLPEPQTTPWIFVKNFRPDPSNTELKYLKSITYLTKSEVHDGVFRVRIFSANDDGSPKDDLLTEEIIVKVKKGKQKNVVDLASQGLEMPKEGILVGFESLLTENNKYMKKVLVANTNKSVLQVDYSPRIMYSYIDTEDSYTYQAGIWTKQLFRWFAEAGKKQRVIAPAISLTLTN